MQIWPICGRIVDPKMSKPFLIGLYCGNCKPKNAHEYLDDFLNELVELEFGNDCGLSVYVQLIICHAPARAYILQTKGHSGFYACIFCVVRGRHDG